MIRRRLDARRIVALCCVLLLPLLVVCQTYLTRSTRAQITFHEQERSGVAYLRPVTALLLAVVDERVGASHDLAGAVFAVDAADTRYGPTLGTSDRWRRWKALEHRVTLPGTPTAEQFDQLTGGLADLLLQVANTSNLILDPDLDSYYLMDVVAQRDPILLDQLGRAVALARNGPPSAADHDGLVVARAVIDAAAATVTSDIVTSSQSTSDPQVTARLAAPSAAFAAAAAEISGLLGRVLAGQQPTVDPAGFVRALTTLDATSSAQLDRLLTSRIDGLALHARTLTEVLVGLAGVLLLLSTALVRALRLVWQKSDELRHQAGHDALTGLPNRALVLDRVERALARAPQGGAEVAVLFIDLDGFKDVNDTYGHAAGDQLLRAVSVRLRGALRDGDTVGRLGGDEFVVLAEGTTAATGPEVIAERLQAVLAEPFDLDAAPGVRLRAHASIGIAVGARAAAADLLRDADVALYEAKAAGKDCYVLFAPQMQRAVQDRLELELDLRAALGTDQLFLVYQPTVDLRTERITGVEALVRWIHPTRGLVMPDVFVPVAEESGLIVPIGRLILREACRQAAVWERQGHPLSVAVNISGRQLDRHGDLLDDVRSALADGDLDPTSLTLEITETMLMRDAGRSAHRIEDLKALGLRVAIDDFGTGYSSLAYLQRFPVDVLKIDRSFILGVARTSAARALVHTFVELGKTFGLETWAEGIEDASQLRILQEEGCDSGQGYLFARPLSPEGIAELLTDQAAADHPIPRQARRVLG